MRILFAGDWHANVHHARLVIDSAARLGFDRIVQVGDFGYWPRFKDGIRYLGELSRAATEAGQTIWWCDGNHEDHISLPHRRAEGPVEVAPNIYWVPRGAVLDWTGRRLLFMGGAVSVDRNTRVSGTSWFHEEVPSEQAWDRALSAGRVDLVVAHDTVSAVRLRGIPDALVPAEVRSDAASMRQKLDEVLSTARPRLWVHGHWHQRRSTDLDECRVETLGTDGQGLNTSTLGCDLDNLSTWAPMGGL